MLSATSYFYLAAALLCIGLLLVLTRRNGVLVLLGVECMLNAANLNLVAFNTLHPHRLDGHMTALFVLVVAAAEAAVALAIILNLYDKLRSVNLEEADTLKH